MLLSEMFGVERDTDFMVKGYSLIFQINLYTDNRGEAFERLVSVGKNGDIFSVSPGMAYYAISIAPSGIIRLPPPLTNEQREQLKAIWTLGGRWLAKDKSGDVYAYDSKPEKREIYPHWNYKDEYEKCFTVICELSVCSLVSWSDSEPYDIGKALGVEG